jgi:hypothetical protein
MSQVFYRHHDTQHIDTQYNDIQHKGNFETPSINDTHSITTIWQYAECQYAEFYFSSVVMLNVIMLSATFYFLLC